MAKKTTKKTATKTEKTVAPEVKNEEKVEKSTYKTSTTSEKVEASTTVSILENNETTPVVEVKEEVVEKVSTDKKDGFFKKTWKYVITGVTCAAVGVGVTLGADANKVQETLTKAQANQVAIAAATYSAEQVLNKVQNIKDAESKAQAVKEVIVEVQAAMPQFMEAANVAKETVSDVKDNIGDIKDAVTSDKK